VAVRHWKPVALQRLQRALFHARPIAAGEVGNHHVQLKRRPHEVGAAGVGLIVIHVGIGEEPGLPILLQIFPMRLGRRVVQGQANVSEQVGHGIEPHVLLHVVQGGVDRALRLLLGQPLLQDDVVPFGRVVKGAVQVQQENRGLPGVQRFGHRLIQRGQQGIAGMRSKTGLLQPFFARKGRFGVRSIGGRHPTR